MTSTQADVAGHAPTGRGWQPVLRILRVELRDELLAIVREPAALFFSMAMPVAFYALFVALWGAETSGATAIPTTVATSMLATFGTFGVLGVTLRQHGYEGKIAVSALSDDDHHRLIEAGADKVLRPFRDAARDAVTALERDRQAYEGSDEPSPW
jgi:hypothetical protein